MMADKSSAISVNSLSKIYPLYNSPRDRLKEALHPRRRKYHTDFYALREVSMDIRKGETVGIIGQNGSGKSTLLSIIAGVLTPSAGNVQVVGKVSSLLELGTGFNPELTGIENIYFFGAIQGIPKLEMDGKLNEIVTFADIGEFINQPVKVYSSGMYVRLAFAVAINVDPEILIIDEALAVGDMRFQQKCYRKINEFRERGKTIILCSHDTSAILQFCTSCIWIHEGSINSQGDPATIVKEYIAWSNYRLAVTPGDQNPAGSSEVLTEISGLRHLWRDISSCSGFGDQRADILSVAFYDQQGRTIQSIQGGTQVNLAVQLRFNAPVTSVILGFNVKNKLGENVFGTNTRVEGFDIHPADAGMMRVLIFSFILPNLCNGIYSVDVAVASGEQHDHVQHCWKYDVIIFTAFLAAYQASFGQIYLPSEEVKITMATIGQLDTGYHESNVRHG